jgi:hypothetical protein
LPADEDEDTGEEEEEAEAEAEDEDEDEEDGELDAAAEVWGTFDEMADAAEDWLDDLICDDEDEDTIGMWTKVALGLEAEPVRWCESYCLLRRWPCDAGE